MTEIDGGSFFVASVATGTSTDCSHYCYHDDDCDLATFYKYKGIGMCYIYRKETFQPVIGGTSYLSFGKICRGKPEEEVRCVFEDN